MSDYSFDEYKKIWGSFDSALFDFKTTIFYQHRDEFCYAGDWSAYLNLDTGSLRQCYCGKTIDNIYQKMDAPIHFEAIGHKCELAHCYNGHSFIVLGDIPGINSPTYADERNRICQDGSEWLQPAMKSFMSTRLYESNKEYSVIKKAKVTIQQMGKIRGFLSQYKFYQKLSQIKRGKDA